MDKTPYEVILGRQLRLDIEMFKIISESCAENGEELPLNFANIFNECKLYAGYIFLEKSSLF